MVPICGAKITTFCRLGVVFIYKFFFKIRTLLFCLYSSFPFGHFFLILWRQVICSDKFLYLIFGDYIFLS